MEIWNILGYDITLFTTTVLDTAFSLEEANDLVEKYQNDMGMNWNISCEEVI